MKIFHSSIYLTIALAATLVASVPGVFAKDTAKSVTALDSSAFESKIASGKGVALVDFWATWCGPCLKLAPTVKEIANDYEGKVFVGKIDVDQVKDVTQKCKIEAMPTLIIFKDGKEVDRIVGAVPKNVITAKLDSALEN